MAILNSEYHTTEDRVNSQVWTDCLWDIDTTKVKSGVFSSLVKKGLIGSVKDPEGDVCWITQEGFDVMKDKAKWEESYQHRK